MAAPGSTCLSTPKQKRTKRKWAGCHADLHYDDALEESPELLQQFDGANDSDVERPGKVEVVTGNEPDEGEKDGGGWVVVGTQRKTREEPSRMVEVEKKEGRTGRLERLYPSLLKLHY